MPEKLKKPEESSTAAFQSRAMKTDAKQPGRVEPRSFEETTTIQKNPPRACYIYIPQTIAREMGFNKGSQVRVRLEEGRITAELMKEPRCISKIWKKDENQMVTIKPELLKIMESEEGEWHLPDAAKVERMGRKYSSFVITLSLETIKKNNLKGGTQVEQIIRGRELILKPVPLGEEFYLQKIEGVCDPYLHSLRINIPKGISDRLDKEKWNGRSTVGFEINERGQLAIIPQQASERAVKYSSERAVKYSFADKKQFYYLITRLSPDEQKAFIEIGEIIEREGKIATREMKEIFRKHTPIYILTNYPETVNNRFYDILKYFVKDGGLEKLKGFVEKTDNQQPKTA